MNDNCKDFYRRKGESIEKSPRTGMLLCILSATFIIALGYWAFCGN